ncbi:Hypothetical protein CINCED_3A000625 [Cinara cedri]|uniref:Ionotropic receptor 75a N-terminal domain-containing protein n=1 Tax=Cinara cedri TaxID=506608 RepID=A0A5E4M8L9_9HEMI|nr:Hypothetical protein CINCED_3A000625 [Cinara cedri]
MKNMKHLNEKNIAVTYRNGYSDAYGYFSNKDKSFELSLYSPSLGVIVDWSCNKDWMLFQFTESWLWNASYHWLMMMETSSNKTIQSFLASKNINLTIDSEVLLAYPDETDKNMFSKRWHIFDVYRTAFKPRGKLVIDVLNETFGQWGNRLWKFDERLNLQNLTVNVAALINPVGRPATKNTEVNVTAPSSTEIVKYLQTFDLDRSNALEKFAFAIMYPLTKNILNMT